MKLSDEKIEKLLDVLNAQEYFKDQPYQWSLTNPKLMKGSQYFDCVMNHKLTIAFLDRSAIRKALGKPGFEDSCEAFYTILYYLAVGESGKQEQRIDSLRKLLESGFPVDNWRRIYS